MEKHSINLLIKLINENHEIVGGVNNKFFSNVKMITDADEDTLVWINPTRKDKQELVEQTKANIIICDNSIKISDKLRKSKCFILVENPKLTFIKIINNLFIERIEYGIHHTTIIHPEAEIHKNVYIGPFCYVGRCIINEGTIIHGHCYIYDNVKIGKNVNIFTGCVIGAEGFGFVRDKTGILQKFPHLGGVIIEDEVELQAMTNVDRGTLGDTLIGRGTKIDTQCHIGHNSKIGRDNIITARAMIGGSSIIGDRCFIGPSTTIRDVIEIGNESFIGIGSLLVKSLKEKSVVMGSPAKPIDEYKKLLKIIIKLIKEEKNEK